MNTKNQGSLFSAGTPESGAPQRRSGFCRGTAALCVLLLTGVSLKAAAEDALIEPFDDASQFSVSSGFFSDGGFDFLGISDGAGGGDFGGGPVPVGIKTYTGLDGSFLTGMDLNGEGATLPVVLEWSGIDISGLSDLQFSGDFAEFFDAPGDIDADDFIRLDVSIDGGPFVTFLEFRLDVAEPDNFNGIFREDTDFDGRGDGASLTDAAATFTKPIPGTGSTLALRLNLRVEAGDEDFAADNFLISGSATGPTTGLLENFDDASQFSVSSGLFSDGGFDFLGISDGAGGGDFGGDPVPSGIKAYTGFDGSFLTGIDLDGEGATLPVVLEWNGIDISEFSALQFSGDFAELFDAPGDIDFDDFIRVEASIDGGLYVTVLEFRLDEDEPDNFNGVFREDTDGDGRGDGTALTGAAETFTKPITGIGSTLDLRLTVRLNAGDEDFAVDSFRIEQAASGLVESFNNASRFTVSSGFFSDGGFDFLGISDGAGGGDFGGDPVPTGAKAYSGFDGSFLTGMDLDGEGAVLPVVLEWSAINIGGLSTLQFSGDFAEFFDAPGDVDFDDFLRVEASIDGGPFATVLEFRLDQDEPDNFNGIFREDTDGDGRGDGAALSGAAATFTKPIAGTGISLALRLTARVNAGDEDFAVDNFVISEQTVAPPPVELVRIHEIQGSGDTSPLVGEIVQIEGVVVGAYPDLGGFFVQEEDADADGSLQTSEGIWVFEPGASVAPGDRVAVTGTVIEFGSGSATLTELTSVSSVSTLETGRSDLVSPTILGLPVGSVGEFEAFEGMLVQFPQTLTVTETFNLARFGTVSLATERLYNPTHLAEPGAAAQAVADLNARSRIELDDGQSAQNPDPVIYPVGGLSGTNTLRSGDTVTGLSAVLDQRFGTYRLQPVGTPDFLVSNPRPSIPPFPGGSLTVASVNVLNYFVTTDTAGAICGPANDQSCRGADSASELERQTQKIVAALGAMSADVYGLVELENSAGVPVLATLVDELNQATGPGTYDFVDTGTVGSDAIKVGFIYKPSTVTPTGPFAILDTPAIIPDRNRVPLAQTFEENASGEKLTLVVNHFKSKGSACADIGDPDTGDGQGNCNLTRTAIAEELVSWLATDPTGSGDPDFMILGDLNAYAMEDPIDALKNGGYTDLTDFFIGPSAYSFVFFGQFGYLDHALSSETLTPQVTGLTEWHINADEPRALDYNEEFKTPGQVSSFFDPGPFRSSDHDPLIVGLSLQPATPTPGDIDGDGDVDMDDISLILAARNQPASGPDDPRDLDGDGVITVLDARRAVTLCTRAGCATE